MLQKGIHKILLRLVREMYRIKQVETRLKELALNLSKFQKRLSEVVELVKNQLAWIGDNPTFPSNIPQKTT